MTSADDAATTDLATRLQTALDLAQSVENHGEASRVIQAIVADLQDQSPEAIALFQQLWRAYISSQRSSQFWQQISEAEKNLSDRLSASHVQLKQNYLRLIEEQ
ncbi:MAG: hypothetical protein VKI82_09840 [Leptolyngbya sp.]|nr:hypothetical protein [Leptolyngbya sp.]